MESIDTLSPVFKEIAENFSSGLKKNISINRMDENAIIKWSSWKNTEGAEQRQKPNGGYNWAALRN